MKDAALLAVEGSIAKTAKHTTMRSCFVNNDRPFQYVLFANGCGVQRYIPNPLVPIPRRAGPVKGDRTVRV